jgi:hypothetical protein
MIAMLQVVYFRGHRISSLRFVSWRVKARCERTYKPQSILPMRPPLLSNNLHGKVTFSCHEFFLMK